MANVSLKSIKFPGLSDTYTVPQIDDTLTTAGKAADAKATGDQLGDLQSAVAQKANIDGSYANMTAGNAEQLVSTVFIEDSTPYKYRTSGGTADIGDREYDEIVGGTVAWNQLVDNPVYSGTNDGVTVSSDADGLITVSGKSDKSDGYINFSIVEKSVNLTNGHVYFINSIPKTNTGTTNMTAIALFYGNGGSIQTSSQNGAIVKQNGEITGNSICYIRASYTFDGTFAYYLSLFDLTQMFGSTIADYIYSLETATPGAGVAWFRKLFPANYYAYNTGELISVAGLQSHDMTGFNQWNEEWEVGTINVGNGNNSVVDNVIRSKNYCDILPNTTYYATCGKTDGGNQNRYYIAVIFYDADKNYISSGYYNNLTFKTPSNARYFKITTNTSTVVYGNTYNHDICINLSWDGERNGEYEPYVKHSYPLDSTITLRGIPKLDSENHLYYDGDVYQSDGTVTRKYGVVDLGTLNWVLNATNEFAASVVGAKGADYAGVANAVYGNYVLDTYNHVHGHSADKTAAILTNSYLYVYDTAYTDAATFKTAMSGVYLVYELATPTTETADTFQSPQIVDDFGTEEYVTTTIVPVGHNTKYANNLRAKLEMAPESPDGDGDYIVRQTNGQNTYVPLLFPASDIPAAPTTDGNYTLKCTVASGTATYTWEAQA